MREFIPESKKDDEYWSKRQKNNEAAKRSREKRRANDAVMMRRIHELSAENKRLKLEVDLLRRQLGLQHHPTTSESLHPASCVTLDAAGSSDPQQQTYQLLTSTVDRCADDVVSAGAYRATVHPVRGETIQLTNESNYLHHLRHAVPHEAAEWPPTTFSTSTSAPYRHHSASGNPLPSIGDLCGGRVSRQDGRDGGPSCGSMTGADRSDTRREPQTSANSLPIVIFSDVSSSEDDSVDDSPYGGRQADTLTMRASVSHGTAAESPLNLSTPSRHHSPVLTRPAYDANVDRSDVVFAHVASSWKTESEPTAADAGRHGDTRHPSYVWDAQSQAVEWLTESRNGSPEDTQRDQLSRSTSLSSVASVAWQSGVEFALPQQPPVDDAVSSADLLPACGRQVRCGLPLKVRRKLGSTSPGKMTTVDASRTSSDQCSVGVSRANSGMWSEHRGPASAEPSVSLEFCRPPSTERDGRFVRMSDSERRPRDNC